MTKLLWISILSTLPIGTSSDLAKLLQSQETASKHTKMHQKRPGYHLQTADIK